MKIQRVSGWMRNHVLFVCVHFEQKFGEKKKRSTMRVYTHREREKMGGKGKPTCPWGSTTRGAPCQSCVLRRERKATSPFSTEPGGCGGVACCVF